MLSLLGTVWIFPHASEVQHDDPSDQMYCEGSVFKFGLGITIIDWILIGGVVVIGLPVLCCHLFDQDCC